MSLSRLPRAIGPAGFFSIAFGSIVGSGWVLVLGEWLRAAGPGGSILGFAIGGSVMMLIALCYGELASRLPKAGGEFAYALHFLGPGYAFAVAWVLTLFFAAFTAFEGIAMGWIVGTLLPGIEGPTLYSLLGARITQGGLILGIGFAAVLALLNFIGTRIAIGFQRIVTFGFIGLAVALIIAALTLGDPGNAQPLFQDYPAQAITAPAGAGQAGVARGWPLGAFWIFSTTAVFLNGFQTSAYGIEERTAETEVRVVIMAMLFGVFAAILFYCGMIYAVANATPWHDTVSAELPAAYAFGKLTAAGMLGKAILIGAAFSLLKSWNAYILCGARLLFALAREGYLPRAFAQVQRRFGSPAAAILAIFVLNVVGVLCGRGAIVPIVDMSAICTTGSFVICLIALLRARAANVASAFQVPGGNAVISLALIGAFFMAGAAIYEPASQSRSGIPIQWTLLILWSFLGLAVWAKARGIIKPSSI
jgi:basic amino acid/polyamine antiporter, APA family